jgi:predicted nucleotide-binding protein (sugar kinase/HSP70/actin superfamily)
MAYYIHYDRNITIDISGTTYYQVIKTASNETATNYVELTAEEFMEWVTQRVMQYRYYYINETDFSLANSYKNTTQFDADKLVIETQQDVERIIELNNIIQAKTDMNLDYSIEASERTTILDKY